MGFPTKELQIRGAVYGDLRGREVECHWRRCFWRCQKTGALHSGSDRDRTQELPKGLPGQIGAEGAAQFFIDPDSLPLG